MKKTSIPQVRIIETNNAADFQNEFNSAFMELSSFNPRFERDSNNPYLCFIFYEVENIEAETIAEEYELSDEIMHCVDCPNYFVSEDKRIKPRCLLHGWRIAPDRQCCDEYYSTLEDSIQQEIKERRDNNAPKINDISFSGNQEVA